MSNLSQKYLSDITEYIDFLRKKGYSVTVSCVGSHFSEYMPVLLPYQVHLPAVCYYLKSHPKTNGVCVAHKQRLIGKNISEPYYSCCWAGVEELVVPVVYEGKVVVYIDVSGYRSQTKRAAFRAGKAEKLCGEEFSRLYSQLSPDVHDFKELITAVKPLEYMFLRLYEQVLKNPAVETRKSAIYRSVLEFVYDNFMNPLRCSDIANAINYSESYLRHVFREKCGMSLNDFITSVRLDKAQDLLTTTDRNITEIASDTGFCDANYFCTVFSKRFGISPARYRKRNLPDTDSI